MVTGGAGFIGSEIARELIAGGHSVRVFDNLSTGFERNVPPEAELITGDLRDAAAVAAACEGAEVVFHQGALGSVPRSIEDPQTTNDCNVTGTLNVLAASVDAGVRRVVYASSSSAYGDTGGVVNKETLPPRPMSPYAVSKLTGEHYCRVWASIKGLSTVSLRYFNVFGPGQDPNSRYAAVFPRFISALLEGGPPQIYGDGEQSRDFSYVGDVVRANLMAAEAGEEAGGAVLNIGGGHPRTVNEVLRAVSDRVGVWVDPVYLPPRPGDVRKSHADISAAAEVIGWSPEAPWDVSVAATVEWFRSGAAGLSGE